MEARTLVPLPSAPDASSSATRVQVLGDRIVVDRLVLHDPLLAACLADRAVDDRPALVERALRIGLIALQDAGVSVNVDVVRAEFERVLRQTEQVNERAAVALNEGEPLNSQLVAYLNRLSDHLFVAARFAAAVPIWPRSICSTATVAGTSVRS